MNRLHLVALAIASLHLAACGGGGGSGTRPDPPPERPPGLTPSDPQYHLGTDRFTTHQPQVLEQIGAHHAYAKGLTLHVAQHAGAAPGVGDEAVVVAGGVELGAVVVRVTMRCADGFTVDCTLAPWALAGARRSRVRARHPH